MKIIIDSLIYLEISTNKYKHFIIAIDPIFQITDLITNTTANFTGFYTIEAIAGGTKLENIKDYSYSIKRKVNPRANAGNLKLIWSPSEAFSTNPSMMTLEKNQIRYIK